jgi:hypothetical protein
MEKFPLIPAIELILALPPKLSSLRQPAPQIHLDTEILIADGSWS